MSTQQLPHLDTVAMRQKLAGLIDKQAERQEWSQSEGRQLAITFLASLPTVFGSELDRLTMWDKIDAAVRAAYAKTFDGDLEAFVQAVLESIKADPSRAVASERLQAAMETMWALGVDERKDWLSFLVARLIPLMSQARRLHKEILQGADAQ